MEHTPAVLVKNHGPFTWGKDAVQAVYHAAVLEEAAKMAAITYQLNAKTPPAPEVLLEKHFQRKHGPHAYYGQTAVCRRIREMIRCATSYPESLLYMDTVA